MLLLKHHMCGLCIKDTDMNTIHYADTYYVYFKTNGKMTKHRIYCNLLYVVFRLVRSKIFSQFGLTIQSVITNSGCFISTESFV